MTCTTLLSTQSFVCMVMLKFNKSGFQTLLLRRYVNTAERGRKLKYVIRSAPSVFQNPMLDQMLSPFRPPPSWILAETSTCLTEARCEFRCFWIYYFRRLSNAYNRWISNSAEAETFLVFANVDPSKGYKGITCFIMSKDMGVEIAKKEAKVG